MLKSYRHQYQLISGEAIRRFWVLVMVAYGFLEQKRARLPRQQCGHVAIIGGC